MQHPSPDGWQAVEAGSWTPLPYYTGTPHWFHRSGQSSTGLRPPRERDPGTLNYLFSTLGGPPSSVPSDLSQLHFLGQLRALKTERDLLERQLEEARVARFEGHMWNAPPQWAGLRPGGSASRGWHAESPKVVTGSPLHLEAALRQQQQQIEQLQLELGTLRQALAQRRAQESVAKAARHRSMREVVADIYGSVRAIHSG